MRIYVNTIGRPWSLRIKENIFLLINPVEDNIDIVDNNKYYDRDPRYDSGICNVIY